MLAYLSRTFDQILRSPVDDNYEEEIAATLNHIYDTHITYPIEQLEKHLESTEFRHALLIRIETTSIQELILIDSTLNRLGINFDPQLQNKIQLIVAKALNTDIAFEIAQLNYFFYKPA